MEPSQYYITTLTNAAVKLGPWVGYIIVGYFLFFKLPFLLALRNMRAGKQNLQVDETPKLDQTYKKDTSVEDYKDFQRRMKIEERKASPKQEKAQEQKKQGPRAETKQQSAQARKPELKMVTPEQIFELRPGEVLTKEELRKRYHELLRMNHPDKVASMGPEFKKLAEQKTKDINTAYEKLKSKAA